MIFLLVLSSSPFWRSQPVTAQDVQYTANKAEYALRSSLKVNPSTLALELQIPLANYAGRGINFPVTLNYSSKLWRIKFAGYVPFPQGQNNQPYTMVQPLYSENSTAGWTSSLGFPSFESASENPLYTSSGGPQGECSTSPCFFIDRINIRMPDGSIHELRSSDVPHPSSLGQPPLPDTLYAVDGSGIKYTRSSNMLYMPDGSRYDLGPAKKFIDRNGNALTFDGSQWTDTLGRPPFPNPLTSGSFTLPGQGSTTLIWSSLSAALTTAEPLRYQARFKFSSTNPPPTQSPSLFDTGGGDEFTCSSDTPFNPVVLSKILLPNGQAYTFTYNIYGEIDKVTYPNGGYERYQYGFLPTLTWLGGSNYGHANRGVTDRWVSVSGNASEEAANHWQYTTTGASGDPYIVQTTAPDLTYSKRYLHRSLSFAPYGFDDARGGMPYDEQSYSSSGQMLRRKLTEWSVSGSFPSGYPATRNPRVTKEVEFILDPGGGSALARTTVYGYDTTYQFDVGVDQTSVSEYDYVVVDQNTAKTTPITSIGSIPQCLSSPCNALRTQETTNLILDTNISQTVRDAYRTRNLLALPSSMRIKNSSGTIVAQSSISYDQYSLTPVGTLSTWIDPQTSYRGNPTTMSQWVDTTGTYLATHAYYDQFGNVRTSVDAKGNQSQTDYSSDYKYAYPTTLTTAVPDTSGQYGSTTPLSTIIYYDFSTGKVVSTTDANGKTTSYAYTDPLNRLKQVTLPDGGRTTYTYVDAHQCGPYVETRTLLDSTGRETDAWQFFDGLGRPYLVESLDNQDPNNPYLRVDTQYDSLGRAWRVSNPYRTAGCTSTPNPSGRWTQTTFDALSRPTQSKTTADNAVVTTSYSLNTVTVTDQAGKIRRSVTDGLGRLTRVDEPDSSGNLGLTSAPVQPTNYTYDVLGNLRRVVQGSQQRFFMYDSLSRLIRAKNPEQSAGSIASNITDPITGNAQWSMAYGYDNNGNLTARVDARNVTTTYAYDALNRNTTVRYTDGTKDVDRHYDNPTANKNGLGRFWYFNWDAAQNTRFDSHLAIDQYDAMGRPLNYRQHFLTNGVASQQFNVTRTYDKAGHVLTQTYPSGRSLNYGYDIAGRLNSDGGNLGDGVARTYSTAVTYSEFGGLQQEQFGTQTALYHKLHYTVRGQLYDIRLSTVDWATDQWNWNRGAIVDYYATAGLSCQTNECQGNSGPDNNGNVIQSRHYIPTNDQISSYNWTEDRYSYDSLNRLKSVAEYHGAMNVGYAPQDFAQVYDYDRYGNRTVNQSQTSTNIPHPNYTADSSNNRLVAPAGYNYGYDYAGNQTNDTYTGAGTRTYDGENRLKQAQGTPNGQLQTYTYDADGRRIKRNVNGLETWQVYGIDGELLAEYASGAAPFLPSTEYGYRNGELLVTITNGDTQRLTRFVTNLYYGAKQRDPSAQELQDGINQLAAAGAQSQAQLQTVANQIARSLFTSTNYETYPPPPRTNIQYVSDLYYAYLQRGPDDSGLNWWAVTVLPGSTRENVCNAFEASSEFITLVATLYGTAASDNERTEHLVNNFYLGAYGRIATSTELQQQRDALNAAAAQGLSQVLAQAETFGRSLFTAQVNDGSISNTQYVTNLYEAFLQRGPDAGGLSFWSSQATVGTGRQTVLNNFATCPAFRELSGALYREVNWLVTDHLGTPRMIVNKSGSLASVKRHDYLPFGEEISAGMGGRTTTQGYTGDGVRQKFTQKERDIETGLDYFGARYYASTQGRFTSIDPENYQAMLDQTDPQSWNAYSYVNNNPLRRVDPDGRGFFTKLGNWLAWGVWGEEADVQKVEEQKRAMLLRMQQENPNHELLVQSPHTRQFVLLHPETMNRMNLWLWSNAISSSRGSRDLTAEEAANVLDVGAMKRLEYEASPKHSSTTRGNVSAAPKRGQNALDNSVQVKDTSTRRVGVDYQNREFVVFDETRGGTFHGHARGWGQLTQEMKNALVKSGMASRSGKIY